MDIGITWYGCACFLLEWNGYRILVDPFLDRSPGSRPILPVTKDDVPLVDAIVVTHSHFDHVTSIPFFVHRDHCRVLGNEVLRQTMEKLGTGKIWPDWPDRVDPGENDVIEVVKPDQPVELLQGSEGSILVTPIRSEHIHFDFYQIKRVGASWEFWK
ncbi:MAG TPA: MBL fold metallo-hydrolase, partial [Candidatus Lokiarchaeia archaeon]|nr:MBL fold metallo-hydrolase [Candidatus Lokiarchaeia archaeon]